MKQKVHSVSYLAKAEFWLKEGDYDLVALPAGAEVVNISLEVVGDIPDNANVKVIFKDATTNNFLTFLDYSAATIRETIAINKGYTIAINEVIMVKVDKCNKADTKGVLRVLYFLPSVIEVEY